MVDAVSLGKMTKAARELLGWSQEDLQKKTGLSIATIKNFERGATQSIGTTAAIRGALERAGIQFIEEPDRAGVVVKLG